ncbi:MAG: hypothetical protein ABIN97_13410 [Ginsengibacter sp.]
MNYKINGNLCGFLWEDTTKPILPSEILIYLPLQREQAIATNAAKIKETFRFVTNKEKYTRKNLLLTKVVSDEKGDFEFSLDEKYAKGPLDIDLVCSTVPRIQSVQFHLTTFNPQWHKANESDNYCDWKYSITSKWWCYVQGHYLDAWVICNHLLNCEAHHLMRMPHSQHEMQIS